MMKMLLSAFVFGVCALIGCSQTKLSADELVVRTCFKSRPEKNENCQESLSSILLGAKSTSDFKDAVCQHGCCRYHNTLPSPENGGALWEQEFKEFNSCVSSCKKNWFDQVSSEMVERLMKKNVAHKKTS